MAIDLEILSPIAPPGIEEIIDRVTRAAFKTEGVENCGFSVRLTDDDELHRLNLSIRNIDNPTDVLSFPSVTYPAGKTARDVPKRLKRAYDPVMKCSNLGDCAVSVERAVRQAAEYGHSVEREIGYLVCHSAFHLMGYDHMEDADRAAMRRMEKIAMQKANLAREGEFIMTDEKLFELAAEALQRAYTPYSHFNVGACILCDDGRYYTGCNIENASYGATICAERTAAVKAVSEGSHRFLAIAVASDGGVPWPCGVCRQFLREFGPDMRVIVGKIGESLEKTTLSNLLPHSFGPESLGRTTNE